MYQYIYIFSERIGTFSLCIGLGLFFIVFAVHIQLKRIKADDNLENTIMICLPLSMLFGVLFGVGSDIFFRGGISAFKCPEKYGMTFYGWLLGCILFYFVYSKICHINMRFLINLILPSFAGAQAFGRIGCFLAGCCFGRPCNTFGVIYPIGSLPYNKYGAVPLIPVQLIESLFLFGITFLLFYRVKFRYRALLYLVMMSTGRFFFEFLRGDNRGNLGLLKFFSPAQTISALIFSWCVIWLINDYMKGKNYVRRS